MSQVRDQFANWEPAAPAGVQAAVYAQMGKGSFLRWGWSLNIWTLGLLLGGATFLGMGLMPEQNALANKLNSNTNGSVAWEACYPTAPETLMEVQTVMASSPIPATAVAVAAPAALEQEHITWESNPMAPLAANVLPTTVLTQELEQCPASRGITDLWTQLQDDTGNDIRFVYKVTIDEQK